MTRGCDNDEKPWRDFGCKGWGVYQRGISVKRDCHHASNRSLNIYSDEMLTISSIKLLQYVAAQTLKACRQRRELHRCFINLESMAAKPNSGGKNLRPMDSQALSVLIKNK